VSCACQRPLTLPVPIRASQLVAVVEHRNCFDAEQADFTQARKRDPQRKSRRPLGGIGGFGKATGKSLVFSSVEAPSPLS
jgi:hypothetical protein